MVLKSLRVLKQFRHFGKYFDIDVRAVDVTRPVADGPPSAPSVPIPEDRYGIGVVSSLVVDGSSTYQLRSTSLLSGDPVQTPVWPLLPSTRLDNRRILTSDEIITRRFARWNTYGRRMRYKWVTARFEYIGRPTDPPITADRCRFHLRQAALVRNVPISSPNKGREWCLSLIVKF